MGICDSRGIIYDFTGAIGVDDMAFGSPTRYITLEPKHAKAILGAVRASVPFITHRARCAVCRAGRPPPQRIFMKAIPDTRSRVSNLFFF